MKTWKTVFFGILAALILAAAGALALWGKALWDPWGLRLTAHAVSPQGITITGIRTPWAGGIPTTGSYYFLEKREKGAWVTLPPKANEETLWTLVAYGFPRGIYDLPRIDFSLHYHDLSPGQYRLGKRVSAEDREGNRETRVYYAPFTI